MRAMSRDCSPPRTFLLPTGHARPIWLLANDQLEVRTGVGQHCQLETLDS